MATRNNKTRPAEHRGYNVKKFRDIVVMDANSTPLATSFFVSLETPSRLGIEVKSSLGMGDAPWSIPLRTNAITSRSRAVSLSYRD